jgi:predicted nuclease with TOPRIM domain
MSEQTEAQRLAELIRRGEWSSTTFNGIDQIRQAADELRRLEAENTRLQASLEECSGNCTALKDQVRRMRSELERPMSSEATVLVHDNARLRKELEALRGAVPAGWKLVPVSLLKRAESSLGSFCSDLGWADKDMEVMDDISGMLAANPQVQRGNHESKG